MLFCCYKRLLRYTLIFLQMDKSRIFEKTRDQRASEFSAQDCVSGMGTWLVDISLTREALSDW